MQESVLSPVREGERIFLLDVVRGFALFGVMLGNGMEQLGFNLVDAVSAGAGSIDGFFDAIYRYFFRGKARTLFMLLFGIGFALQIERITRRGGDSAQLFRRRLLVLLGIGVAHQFLFSMLDIIHFYALLGFTLLLFRHWPPARLFRLGLVFAAFGFPLSALLSLLFRLLGDSDAIDAVKAAEVLHRSTVLPDASYWQFVQLNAARYLHEMVLEPWFPGFLVQMFGVFLLGLWIAKRDLVRNVDSLLPLFRRWWLPLMLAGVLVYAAIDVFRPFIANRMPASGWVPLWFLITVGWLLHAAAYVMVISLLLARPSLQRLWRGFAAVGRMALTNYLMQSLFFLFVLYGPGLGLLHHFGATWMFALSVTAFAIQIGFSAWWLRRFRFGPLEWLWRSLTYRQRQPIRRERSTTEARPA